MELDQLNIEKMIREILCEKLSHHSSESRHSGVIAIRVPEITVNESNRMDTGSSSSDMVYTKDLFSLTESPRLGCGIMEMKETTFHWKLNYDEIDYVIDGFLSIIIDGKTVSAGPGELILIPKGSSIQFSVPEKARFLYITYPADWADQK